MARGHPDFGATAPRELTTPQLDSGELAARLGSPNVYDRLGTVIAIYKGDEPIHQVFEANVGSGRRDNFLFSNPFGAYVWRLTALANGHQPGFRLLVPLIGDSPAGVEVIFRTIDNTDTTIELTFIADTGTERIQPGFRWNSTVAQWQFLLPTGLWQTTSTFITPLSANIWHSMKLTADPIAATYGRVSKDGESAGIIGEATQNPPGFLRTMEVQFMAESDAAGTLSTDVAAVIVTVNEL